MTGTAPPYSVKVGEAEIVVVSDGPLDLGPPDVAFKGASEEVVRQQLSRSYLPTDRIVIAQNIACLLLNGKRSLRDGGRFLSGLRTSGWTSAR